MKIASFPKSDEKEGKQSDSAKGQKHPRALSDWKLF